MTEENNRLSGRLKRYAKVGSGVGGQAAKFAGARLLGLSLDDQKNADAMAAALGSLKGPLMKVAQLLATIPGALPEEYAQALAQLQSDAPPMGWPFVKRRMQAELGRDWQSRFDSFDRQPAAAASLGQVHRAVSLEGQALACKLQYPDMDSAVEADLNQLQMLFALHKRMGPAIDTSEISKEISARIREELDYKREARHMKLYGNILADEDLVRVPELVPDLSTGRLLTMNWLDGEKLLDFKDESLEVRNRLSVAMFRAWWRPFSHYGVIHGDPHLGNYTVFREGGAPAGINLLDYGCIRIFPTSFVQGVIDLYRGLETGNRDQIVSAYENWGFEGLNDDLIEILNIWAGFIYGPLLENRVRTVADGINPGSYGRKEAFRVHKALKEKGPVKVPREFVFMDRAAIGLGAVFLHLRGELNYYELLNEQIENFDLADLTARQSHALNEVGLEASPVNE